MGRYRKDKGDWGEERAAAYLESSGYRIRERQFRSKAGEIDIIAEKNDTLHFIEVKTRSDEEMGEPLEAIDYRKLRHILRTAEVYLSREENQSFYVSIDAIGITGEELEFIEGITL